LSGSSSAGLDQADEMEFGGSSVVKKNIGIRKNLDDSGDIDVDDEAGPVDKNMKPPSHQSLDYRRWRTEILPAITQELMGQDEI